MKKCTQCEKDFPENTENFYKMLRAKNGLHPWCKKCFKLLVKSNRQKRLDEDAATKSKYYQKNKEHLLAGRKAWAQENRDRVRISKRQAEYRRRSLSRNAGYHSEEEWNNLCSYYGNVCVKCYKAGVLTRDHIIPLSLGGQNSINNIQPLCRSCNSSKGNKTCNYAYWFMVA